MNIFEKMSAVTAEISAVAKNLDVGWGKNHYKAVGEADVLAAVKPAEAKHGIYSYPLSRNVIESGVLISTKTDGSETKQQFMRVETVYRFVNMEKPEEFIDITTYGDGVDSQDKAPGKAMTYADKYALLKAYKIITGDDPDQEYSKDLKDKTTRKTAAQTKNKPAAAQQASADPGAVISPEKAKALVSLLSEHGLRPEFVAKLYGVASIDQLTEAQHRGVFNNLDKFVAAQKKEDEKA